MPRVLSVVGTRPNFMKTAPVVAAIARRGGIEHVLVHTGQHYDDRMSEIFFEQLGVGEPDIRLEVGAGHARADDRAGDGAPRARARSSTRPTSCSSPAT